MPDPITGARLEEQADELLLRIEAVVGVEATHGALIPLSDLIVAALVEARRAAFAECAAHDDERSAAMLEWARLIRLAEDQQTLLDIADDIDINARALQTKAIDAAASPASPHNPHQFVPDSTKQFCSVCGSSVWGIHRFQAEPPREPTIVGERWDDVNVGNGVLYGRCPRCGVARICEWCPPPCNTQSARYARGQRIAVPERTAESRGEAPAPSLPGGGPRDE